MEWYWILLLVLALAVLAPTVFISSVIYTVLFVRTGKEKFGRNCSFPDDPEYVRMYNLGLDWGKEYEACKRPVELVSDGYRLVGEYFDFGGSSAVLIVAGRTECLLYSYYFAEPFRKAGRNVLVVDNRSHGLSEGRVNSLGYREYRDLLAWARLLHEELGNETVLFHGICIGASAALFALTSPGCPDYLEGMIADGMYYNFFKSFDNHMKADRPHTVRFPVMQTVMLWIRLFSRADVVFDGPFRRIEKLDRPILFLYSREDTYSTPDQAEYLFAHCRGPKQIVWFDKGAHSRIRINDTEAYDAAVGEFLTNLENKQGFLADKA